MNVWARAFQIWAGVDRQPRHQPSQRRRVTRHLLGQGLGGRLVIRPQRLRDQQIAAVIGKRAEGVGRELRRRARRCWQPEQITDRVFPLAVAQPREPRGAHRRRRRTFGGRWRRIAWHHSRRPGPTSPVRGRRHAWNGARPHRTWRPAAAAGASTGTLPRPDRTDAGCQRQGNTEGPDPGGRHGNIQLPRPGKTCPRFLLWRAAALPASTCPGRAAWRGSARSTGARSSASRAGSSPRH